MRLSKALLKKYAAGSYIDIGHGREPSVLWAYDLKTGELRTKELNEIESTIEVHSFKLFPGLSSFDIAGRFAPVSNRVSFHVSRDLVNDFGETRLRGTVNHIVDLLKETFGHDIEINFFGDARSVLEAMKKEADGSLHYMDVGHSGGPATLWGYRFDEDRLYYEKVTDSGRGDKTHSDLFKDLSGGVNTRNSDKFDAWGRIDLRTNRGSVAFPQNKSSYIEYRARAKILKEKLQSKFGDVDFVYYWPDDVMELMATKKEAYGGDGKVSYMIALYPKNVTEIEKFKQSLQLEDAEEILNPDQFHITLRYWPDHENLEDKIATFLHKSVNAKEHISLTPKGLDLLGDDGCLVIEFEPDSIITDLFEFIDDGIQELGVPPSDYPTFRPHMTLAVGVKNIPDKQPKFKIIIDRIALVQNDKVLWESKI